MKPNEAPTSTMTLPMSLPKAGHLSRARSTTTHNPSGRDIVLFKPAGPLEHTLHGPTTHTESPFKALVTDVNARAISPRAIQDLSLELYAGGIISWEEHEDLAFQADLHPDFPRTIGALTGDTALPDQPRDYVKEWEQRLAFEGRHAPKGPKHNRALRILAVLRRMAPPKLT